jgi:hypothetical protein
MSAGEPFNPYGLHAIRVPLGMLTYPGISAGAKLLYGRLALHLGKPRAGAHCDPNLDTLAGDMATSVDTINRWLAELIAEKLIERRRRGRFRAACVFLPHPCLFNSAELRNQDTAPIPQPCGVEAAPNSADLPVQFRRSAVSIPQNCGVAYKEENIHENIHENVHSSSSVPEVQQRDDEPHFSEETKTGKPEDLDSLVSTARDQLRAARAAGAGVPLEQIGEPDRAITIQILKVFSDGADFQTWLESTVSRGVARKAKSATWGLFLSDAKNQAQDLRLKRESEENRERDWQIEQERRQAAEAEQRRVMETPMPIAGAAGLVKCAVPWPLQARFERTGEPVSPNELERRAKAWHRCAACRDNGTTGSAIDSDLRFCGCAAGIEAQYRDGADWPARETERVHAGAKSLLLAACREMRLDFVGDAIEAAAVSDDGEALGITLTPEWVIAVSDADVKQALERIGWRRVVRITRPARPTETQAAPPLNGAGIRPIAAADFEPLLEQRRASRGAAA